MDDRIAAYEIFDAYRGGRTPEQPPHQASPTHKRANTSSETWNNSRQISNDVANRFVNQTSKFSGESTENWAKYLESYERMSNELELSSSLKVKLFHHILRDHGLEHYRDNIENKVTNYEDIIALMEKEFCSKIMMETIAQKLESLHISQIEENEKNEDNSLKEVAKTIQELSPQAPKECRTDRYKKKVLYDATCGKDWALNVSS